MHNVSCMKSKLKEFRQVAGNTRTAVPAFLLGDGPDRQMYTLVDAYCPAPESPGGEISIQLVPDRSSGTTVSFELDIFKARLKTSPEITEAQRAIATDFAKRNWNLLARRRQAVRAWGLANLERKMDYRPGDTFGFHDFQAQTDDWFMRFEHQGRRWHAVDMNCVNPTCSCSKVFFNFFEDGQGRTESGSRQPRIVARLDLKTGTFLDENERPIAAEWANIAGSFLESLGDWFGELSLRRDLMRKIARKRLGI
jgi:hypothetical protein